MKHRPLISSGNNWQLCKEYFNHQCAYCGREILLYRDHISSQLNADSSYLCYNIVPACKFCNSSKRDKNMVEWYMKKEFFSQERLDRIIKWSESQRCLYNDFTKNNTLKETKCHFASKIFLTIDRELLAWVDAQAKAEYRDRNNWIIAQIKKTKEAAPMKSEHMTAMKDEFGSVEFEGKTYILADQANHTNRLLPYNGYNDPDDDGNYDFEMSAPAYDMDGNGYTVYWIFNTEKDEDGDNKELDSYDYDKVDRVSEN